MARTHRHNGFHHGDTWNKPGKGKFYKRQLHKAERKLHRGTGGKQRSVTRLHSECNWKGT